MCIYSARLQSSKKQFNLILKTTILGRIIVILEAFLAALLFAAVANSIFLRQRKAVRKSQQSFSSIDLSRPLILRAATVADDMFPIMSHLKLQGSTIEVVGGDGEYIVMDNGIRLIDGIKEWISAGATVKYFLVCPSARALERFRELSHEVGENFELVVLAQGCEAFGFETLHPTLVHLANGGGNAMWVEYNHPANSKIAYNVKFVGPGAMTSKTESTEFARYSNILNEFEKIAA